MAVWNDIQKTVDYARRNGVKAAWYAAMERLSDETTQSYSPATCPQEELDEQRRLSLMWAKNRESVPISVVVPVYHTPETYLRRMISSVIMQSYTNWELVTAAPVDDTDSAGIIDEYVAKDKRIRRIPLTENLGISENTNAAIDAARGAYIAFLDHDDLLEPDALFSVASAVREAMHRYSVSSASACPVRILYSDEDKCDSDGLRFFEHHEKPDFDPDLLLTNNYICHLCVVRSDLAKRYRLRSAYDGAQDHDLLLRIVGDILSDPDRDSEVVHIPRVLYHWRSHQGSTAHNPSSKRYACEAGRLAVQDLLDGRGIRAEVTDMPHVGFYRVEYAGDIFQARPDIGVVGGRIDNRLGELTGGAYTDKGTILYDHLRKGYSGGFQHRAVLQQDVDAVDIRCFRVRPELRELVREYTGFIYKDGTFLPTESLPDYEVRNRSIRFCKKVRERGYRVLWDPAWVREL